MTDEQYNHAVDLWNSGSSLGGIADRLNVSIYDLHEIQVAVNREARRIYIEDGEAPVRLTHRE